MDLPNDSEWDSYEDNEQRVVADDFEAMAADPDIQRELKDSLLAESSDAIMVLVHLYVRFRHGYIGSQDQEAITRAEKLLSEYYSRDVSAMTNDELIAYFKV